MDKKNDVKPTETPAATVAELKLPEALPRLQKLHTNLRAGRNQNAMN